MHIFKNTNYDFLRWRWHAVILSWVVIIARRRHDLRPRAFRGASSSPAARSVIAQFDQPSPIERCATALDRNYPGGGQDVVVQAYGDPAQRQVMVRVPQVGAEAGDVAEHGAADSRDGAAERAISATFSVVGTEIVGPAVGQELTSKGIVGVRPVARRHPRVYRVPFPVHVRASAPSSRRFTTCWSRSRSWRSSATT